MLLHLDAVEKIELAVVDNLQDELSEEAVHPSEPRTCVFGGVVYVE